MDKAFDSLLKAAQEQAERDKKSSMVCENCGWFAVRGDENMKAAVHFIGSFGQQVPQWIAVEERLPKEGDRVLFYNANDEHEYARMVRAGRCIDDGPTGTRELRVVDLAAPTVNATHWMPLPEPPEVK